MFDITAEIRSIFKLKSILGIFIGIFCIICLRKIIALAVRWKNILLSWGYRTLNVPSLWIPDAHASADSRQPSKDPTSPLLSHLSNGGSLSFAGDCRLSARSHRQAVRVPALRLPDAWPNFLLTWLHLNLNSVTILCSAWVSTINEELSSRGWSKCCNSPTDSNKATPEVEITGIHHNRSIPPRLSSIETSASGSTKELHFRCILFSPEVCLEVTLTRSAVRGESGTPRSLSVLLHMQEVACRLQLVCLAVEHGGTLVLSWDLISPLLIDRLHVLNADGSPLQDELTTGEQRWLKDTVYLAIQKAVPHVMLNSSLLVYQHRKPAAGGWSQGETCLGNIAASTRSARYPILPLRELPVSHTLLDALSATELPAGETFSTGLEPGLHLRIITAILLESADIQRVLDLCGPQGESLLHCAIRLNTSWKRSRQRTTTGEDEETVAATAKRPTINTPGVRLERRSWPNVLAKQADGKSTASPTAMWNWTAVLPLEATGFNLLDICLFTVPDSANAPALSLIGQAVLPLSSSVDATLVSARHQLDQEVQPRSADWTPHVVLLDCQFSRLPTSTVGWLSGDAVAGQGRENPGQLGEAGQVKFMLLLKTKLVTESIPETGGHPTSEAAQTSHPVAAAVVPPALPDSQVHTPIVPGKWGADEESSNTAVSRVPRSPHLNWDRPSSEQLADFMTATVLPVSLPAGILSCPNSPTTRTERKLQRTNATVVPDPVVSTLPQPLTINTGMTSESPTTPAEVSKLRRRLMPRFLSFRLSRRKRRDEVIGQGNNVASLASNGSRVSSPALRTVDASPSNLSCPAGESLGRIDGGNPLRRSLSAGRFFRFLRRGGDSRKSK